MGCEGDGVKTTEEEATKADRVMGDTTETAAKVVCSRGEVKVEGHGCNGKYQHNGKENVTSVGNRGRARSP